MTVINTNYFERKLANSFEVQIVPYSCPADSSYNRISWRMQAGYALKPPWHSLYRSKYFVE